MNSKKHVYSDHIVDKDKGRTTDNKKHLDADGVVDMEIGCITCSMPLYVPDNAITGILTSLEHTGVAILICTCGQAQTIQWKNRQCWNC